nr:YqgQ family protein [Indiicoccus explosivorum]
MKTLYDVMQLLKRYGVFVYTGKKLADIDLLEDELRDLYKSGLISPEEFSAALLILRSERNRM